MVPLKYVDRNCKIPIPPLSARAAFHLPLTPFRLLGLLAALAGDERWLPVMTTTFAEMLEIKTNAVRAGYKALEAAGMIAITPQPGSRDRLITILPAALATGQAAASAQLRQQKTAGPV